MLGFLWIREKWVRDGGKDEEPADVVGHGEGRQNPSSDH